MNILIIDDCPTDTLVLKSMLRKVCGDSTNFCAETIEDALAALLINDIELIFLDLSLPATDGIEFLSQTQIKYKIPIVVVSGYADIKTISKAMEHGAVDYLIKPIQKKLLVTLLNKLGIKTNEV